MLASIGHSHSWGSAASITPSSFWKSINGDTHWIITCRCKPVCNVLNPPHQCCSFMTADLRQCICHVEAGQKRRQSGRIAHISCITDKTAAATDQNKCGITSTESESRERNVCCWLSSAWLRQCIFQFDVDSKFCKSHLPFWQHAGRHTNLITAHPGVYMKACLRSLTVRTKSVLDTANSLAHLSPWPL